MVRPSTTGLLLRHSHRRRALRLAAGSFRVDDLVAMADREEVFAAAKRAGALASLVTRLTIDWSSLS